MKNFVLRPEIFSSRFLKFCVVGFANMLVDFLCCSLFLWMRLPTYVSRSITVSYTQKERTLGESKYS